MVWQEQPPFKKPEQTRADENFRTIFSSLQTLAVAVAALPGSELLVGDPATGPAAYLKFAPEKGLTIRYKPGMEAAEDEGPVVTTPATEGNPAEAEPPLKSEIESSQKAGGISVPLDSETPLKPASMDRSGAGANKRPVENREGGERITLHGRLGVDPLFKTTAKGVLIARFPLAVPEPEAEKKVRWETCLAFGKYAEKVREAQLHKGQAVQVVGYHHQRGQASGKGGDKPKLVKEIYTVMVKPVDKVK